MKKTNSDMRSQVEEMTDSEGGHWNRSAWQTTEANEWDGSVAEQKDYSHNGNGVATPPFSPWPLMETLIQKWAWVLMGGCLVASLAFLAGLQLFKTRYTATAQLLRFDSPNNSEFFKPRQLSEQTFASMLRSPELLQKVSALTKPPIPVERLNSSLTITPEHNSDVVSLGITTPKADTAIEVANLYASEAVRFGKELQMKEARSADVYYKQQLSDIERDRQALVEQMQQSVRESARAALRPSQINDRFQIALMEKLQAAKEDLVVLLGKYTDLHPAVKEQNAKINELQRQLDRFANNPPTGPGPGAEAAATPGVPRRSSLTGEKDSEFEILRTQLQAVETARAQLLTRDREAQLFQKDPPGYAQLFAPATSKNVLVRDRTAKLILLMAFGGMMGVLGSVLLLLGVEFMDERLKTGTDVTRVTRLPLLATLGDLRDLDAATQENWAFRTWTALQNRLSISPNHGLVCGFTSTRAGEGKTTWISLLARAAGQCGFRVLTIGTIPESEAMDNDAGSSLHNGWDGNSVENNPNGLALTTRVLSTPALVTEQLVGQDPQPLVHIPLPGWVWDLQRRKEWQAALNQWSGIENTVILVELPPASAPEAVLLAENLPNLIWLTRSGAVKACENRAYLQTLRDARCNLVGTVLNDEPMPPMKQRFQRWIGCAALFLSVGLCAAQAADNPAPITSATLVPADIPPATNLAFSITTPLAHRAAWQQHFTLGPGDVLNLGLFGQPELNRNEVFIGPDGRVSFLQAQDIPAVGLTVDELRARFDEELAKYYRTPHTIITPVSYHSKKYYILGKVTNRGVYTLERPLTIVEAVARARGLETGLLPDNRTVMELADLQRSFVMRQGKRLPVNLEKLFQEGDLAQNIALEPEDYLYFSPANLKQVYVLGEVAQPGPLPYTPSLTVVGAIAGRGGFSQRAWKGKVLVIRGSINRPQTFIVDVWKTTEARSLDFKLEPKDIVYVNYRPFIRVEELVDLGITAFLQSITVEWTGLNINPAPNQ